MQRHRATTDIAERKNVSMRPVLWRALDALAERAGHGIVSRVIQDWTAREAEAVFGPDWREQFRDEEGRAA